MTTRGERSGDSGLQRSSGKYAPLRPGSRTRRSSSRGSGGGEEEVVTRDMAGLGWEGREGREARRRGRTAAVAASAADVDV